MAPNSLQLLTLYFGDCETHTHTHTHTHHTYPHMPLFYLQPPSIFSSLTSWPITSEHNFFPPSFLTLPLFNIGCQKTNLITGKELRSTANVTLFPGKEILCNQSLKILEVSKNPFHKILKKKIAFRYSAIVSIYLFNVHLYVYSLKHQPSRI